jgi:hypothetical protein
MTRKRDDTPATMGGQMRGPVQGKRGLPLARALGWVMLVCGSSGCGGDTTGPTAASADTSSVADAGLADAQTDASRTQYYAALLTFHGGQFDGLQVDLDRDLSQIPGVLSFGNSHLTPPAVAFALEDQVPQAVKNKDGKFVQVQFNLQIRFGILVEAEGFPADTPKAGSYPLGCKQPLLQVKLNNQMYRSTCPGATGSGSIDVDAWSSTPGGRFRGSFQGKAMAYFYDSSHLDECKATDAMATCKTTDTWVELTGAFDFTLPALNQDVSGQP